MAGGGDMGEDGRSLAGLRILVAEDEYFIAQDLYEELRGRGAEVAGPVATVSDALAAIAEGNLDGAVIDLNLGGVHAFEVVDALVARGVPAVLATGYDADFVPVRFADMPRVDKPADSAAVTAILTAEIQAARARSEISG